MQYYVQAAPPLKDTGNDLVAIKGDIIKVIQVKLTSKYTFILNNLRKFHILALVKLEGYDQTLKLDESKIYLLEESDIGERKYISIDSLTKKQKKLLENRIDDFFPST